MVEEIEQLRRSPLCEAQTDIGASLGASYGWEMAQSFSGISEEHLSVRANAGLVDLSYRGAIRIGGGEAVQFLNGLLTNDVKTLAAGKGMRAAFLTGHGKVRALCRVLNLGEKDAPRLKEIEQQYRAGPFAGKRNLAVTAICGGVEAELTELPAAEAAEYMASYGLKESGLMRLIGATYELLGLMSFLTAGETEVRAWTIPMNSTAQKAAGAIHSDFEKKFIRAEVVNWETLISHDGYPGVRDKGLLRLEGKTYIVKDGDVLVIRHS